ncbi:hypothetical protein HY091_02245 [Candidatus Kaiserbacteria bacterium]|nr:hypothetical protein [Candidatus Kaiserbacteria bacterium]
MITITVTNRQLVDRQKFLEAIEAFAVPLARELGTQNDYVVHDSHTSGKTVLEGFHGFSFIHEYGYSMFGGEGLKIWYHPGCAMQRTVRVFSVDWWRDREYKVNHFDPTLKWQRALRKLMQNKTDAVRSFKVQRARLARRAKLAAEKQARQQQDARRRVQESERLGFTQRS